MDDRRIHRLLRREFSALGWFLLGYYGLMNLLVILSAVTEAFGQALEAIYRGGKYLPDVMAILGNGWGYLAAVGVAILVLLAWKGQELIPLGRGRMTAGTLACLLMITIGIQFLNGLWINLLEWVLNWLGLTALGPLEAVSGASDTLSMFLYASLAGPVAEELIFRGAIQRSLERYGRQFSIVCSAFLFGIFHGNLLQTPYAFLMGLLLGYVAAEYHILWAILLHLFNNLVLADLLTRVSALLPELAGMVVNILLLGGAALASCVILIIRRREVNTYLCREWVDRKCLKCFFTNSGVIVLILLMMINFSASISRI